MSSRAILVTSASLFILVAGCHHEQASAPPTQPSHDTETTSATLPVQPTMMNATANIAVSSEIMKTCNLALQAATTPEDAPQFAFDQSALTISDFEFLNQIGSCLTTGPLAGHHVELVGRTDAMGTTEYNMSLGARRASTVAKQLQTAGVKPAQMDETSRGELDASGQDPAGRQLNRRVDIVLK